MVISNKTKNKIKRTIPISSIKGSSESRKVTASKIKKPNAKNKARILNVIKNGVKKLVKTTNKNKIIKSKKKIKIVPQKKIFTNNKEQTLKLKKTLHNPIIKPSKYSWESKATFNPTAFKLDEKIHIVYRAIGDDDSSVLGYAYTEDGLTIDGRNTYHIYKRFFNYNENVPKINYVSGGGWNGGCEDPRITIIGDTLYMLYNAFDGWGSIRVGLTSMKLDDFRKKKWNWKKSFLISPIGQRHKNWVLFPEKINGKFAILHNLHSDDLSRVLIEYFDNLEEEDFKNTKIESPDPNALPSKPCSWHNRMRSVGPSPIKTRAGWLILYHATEESESNRYKLGAMILDLKDPTKVLYRSKSPILEPDEDYENNGNKPGIVYSCGAVVKKDVLFVYYGGADKFVCVASIKLEELINDITQNKEVKLIKSDKK